MTNPCFGWKTPLFTESSAQSPLRSALLTTYDRPDPSFLAEHFFPAFLKLSYEPDSEGEERHYFLLELQRRLKQLQGHITVISSFAGEQPNMLNCGCCIGEP